MRREKIKGLEFERDLAMERLKNKRRADSAPEEAPGGKSRSTGPTQCTDPISTPGLDAMMAAVTAPRPCPLTGNALSASGLPVSKKFNPKAFNPPLLQSVRSKDRKPPPQMVDAMTAPAPISAIRQYHSAIQPNQPDMQQLQPTLQPNQLALQQHHAAIQSSQPAIQLPQPEVQQFQPAILPHQPVVRQGQPAVQQHHARFNRPTEYSKTIVRVQGTS